MNGTDMILRRKAPILKGSTDKNGAWKRGLSEFNHAQSLYIL